MADSGLEAADPYSATFSLEGEDHTIANSLRFFLNKNPNVSFCGYSMPHPSEEVVNIRVQTTGEISAAQAMRSACDNLKETCAYMKERFQQEVAHIERKTA